MRKSALTSGAFERVRRCAGAKLAEGTSAPNGPPRDEYDAHRQVRLLEFGCDHRGVSCPAAEPDVAYRAIGPRRGR
jgi:hypothetical protein